MSFSALCHSANITAVIIGTFGWNAILLYPRPVCCNTSPKGCPAWSTPSRCSDWRVLEDISMVYGEIHQTRDRGPTRRIPSFWLFVTCTSPWHSPATSSRGFPPVCRTHDPTRLYSPFLSLIRSSQCPDGPSVPSSMCSIYIFICSEQLEFPDPITWRNFVMPYLCIWRFRTVSLAFITFGVSFNYYRASMAAFPLRGYIYTISPIFSYLYRRKYLWCSRCTHIIFELAEPWHRT